MASDENRRIRNLAEEAFGGRKQDADADAEK